MYTCISMEKLMSPLCPWLLVITNNLCIYMYVCMYTCISMKKLMNTIWPWLLVTYRDFTNNLCIYVYVCVYVCIHASPMKCHEPHMALCVYV